MKERTFYLAKHVEDMKKDLVDLNKVNYELNLFADSVQRRDRKPFPFMFFGGDQHGCTNRVGVSRKFCVFDGQLYVKRQVAHPGKPGRSLPVFVINDLVPGDKWLEDLTPGMLDLLWMKRPVVTDLCWKYILERPTEELTRKKAFNFTLLAEDELEKLDGDGQELGKSTPRTRGDILDSIWDSRDKQEILNYVGADNVVHDAFVVRYKGAGSSCIMKIDRTNEQITFTLDDVLD